MRVLGLTGGIATGKSAVARVFERLGATVIDSDIIAREVVAPGQPALAEIRTAFGPGVLQSDGTLNRPVLAQRIFSDPEARATLNRITHPRIGERMREEIAAARARGVSVLVAVIPLLLENNRRDLVDCVIVVAVDAATQEARLIQRDGLSRPEARSRMATQMPIAEKVKRADYVIDNAGDLASTEARVDALWQRLGLGRASDS